jgi:hypothetical protein
MEQAASQIQDSRDLFLSGADMNTWFCADWKQVEQCSVDAFYLFVSLQLWRESRRR